MDISLIICTWNNSDRLSATLSALTRCSPPEARWEVVLVDNNCTDNTKQVAKSFERTLPMHYVFEPKQGLSKARNAGIAAATGSLIVFTDDDVEPCTEWLNLYWHAYKSDPSGSFFGGPVVSAFEGETPSMELLAISPPSVRGLDFGDMPRELHKRESFISANWAVPAKALRTAGTFDESKGLNAVTGEVRTGEETDLMNRLRYMGLKTSYLPNASIRHFVPADKCTLSHVLSRIEASAFSIAESLMTSTTKSRITMLGAPFWTWRRLVQAWLAYAKALVVRKNVLIHYKNYRLALAIVRALRTMRQPQL
jgi:glycosyltransferase involved in cell wall biosynthesis